MQQVPFKTALVMENDANLGDFDNIQILIARLKMQGVVCEFMGRVFAKEQEVKRNIDEYEAIIFGSTFIYPEQIAPIAKILTTAKPKIIIIENRSSGPLERAFLNVVGTKEKLVNFDHHQIFELKHPYFDKLPDWTERFPIENYRKEIEEKQREREKRIREIPTTGRQIKLRNVQLFSKELDHLKSGDIVPQLAHGLGEDKLLGRGIWIMGKTEPVKLLNCEFYDEWEFHEPDAKDLVLWIVKMTGDSFKFDPQWLADMEHDIQAMRDNDVETNEIWAWITGALGALGIPNRHYRKLVYDKILEYCKNKTE